MLKEKKVNYRMRVESNTVNQWEKWEQVLKSPQ